MEIFPHEPPAGRGLSETALNGCAETAAALITGTTELSEDDPHADDLPPTHIKIIIFINSYKNLHPKQL